MGDPRHITKEGTNFEAYDLYQEHVKMMPVWTHPEYLTMDDVYPPESYVELVRKRERRKLWGVKDPRLCFLFPVFLSALSEKTKEVKVISMERSLEASVQSLVARDGLDFDEARRIIVAYENARSGMLELYGPHFQMLAVYYSDLRDNPRRQVTRIADFLGVEVTDEAVDHIK